MPARVFIFTLYLFVIALAAILLFPASAAAVNRNSAPIPPITTSDAATADFWEACSTLGGTAPDDDVPGWISWFDWYSIENPDNPNLIPFCVVVHVGPEPTYIGEDTPAATILALHVRFYRGQPGEIDSAYLIAQINAQSQE